ncbi:MAG: flavodoxin [Eubacteriales bacterium]
MQYYYFTRSGESQKIATELAERSQTIPHKIDDGHDWSGAIHFLKAGASSARKEKHQISYPKPIENEEILLVFPIWAGSLPPAVRSFLDENQSAKITAVVLSAASSLKPVDSDRFAKFYEVKGKNKVAPTLDEG